VAQFLAAVAAAVLFHWLDDVRRLHVVLDLLVLRHHLPVLGRGGQLPVNDVLGALRIDERQRPEAMLFLEMRVFDLDLPLLLKRLQCLVQDGYLRRRLLAFAFEVHALYQVGPGNDFRDLLVADALVDLIEEADVIVQGSHELGERSAFQHGRTLAIAHHDAVGGALHHDLHHLDIVLDVLLELSLLDAVQRRLRDVYVAALDQLIHVAEEEGKQQCANVRAVDVGVGHQDDLAVAQFGDVEVVFADAGAQRRDHGADFFVAQHLVVARLLDVEDLALKRQNRLEAAVASLLGGAAGALALDQIHFAALRLTLGAVGQLARQSAPVQRALAACQIAGLARGLASACRFNCLVDDALGNRRVLVEEAAQALVHECLDDTCDIGVQLALRLTFKLRLRQLHADNRHQPLANIVSREVLLHVLEQPELLTRVVDGARQGGAEARQMRTAIDRIDVVGEAEDGFRVAVVVLQRNLHGHAVALGFHVDRLLVQHALTAVQVLDELGDAAVVLELGLLGLACLGIGGALVGKRDQQALVQEGQLAQTLRQCVVVVLSRGEDFLVGHEVDFGSALLGSARLLQLRARLAFGVSLLPYRSVAPDFQLQQVAKRVHTGDAHSVQSAGDLVGGRVELSSGMQHGHDHLCGGQALAIHVHFVYGNAAAVIDDGNGVVDVNGDFDLVCEAGQRFVYRVIDDLVDQM